MRQGRRLHAFGKVEIGEVQGGPDGDRREVHRDVFRQVLREAHHLDLRHQMADDPTRLFDPGTLVLVDEVDGHPHGEPLVLVDAQEIEVQDLRFIGVPVQVLEHHLFRTAFQREGQDTRIERLMIEVPAHLLVVQRQR